MPFLLFPKVAVRLAHLLHARLSPLTFLLNLSLFSFLGRILLCLASSAHLHTFLLTTRTALQLHLADAAAFNAFILRLQIVPLIVALLVLAIFFLSKGGPPGSSQALSFHAANHLEGTGGEDVNQSVDCSAEYLICNEPPNIPSSPGVQLAPIASAPPLELDKSYGTCTPSDKHHLLANIAFDTPAPSTDLRLAPCSDSLHMNETHSNQLEIVPTSQEVSPSRKFSRTRPKSPSNQVELVHTYSHGNSDKRGILASCSSLDAQDLKLCEYITHAKPSSNTILATPSNSIMLTTIADITLPHSDSSQKSLIRRKSDIQTSNHVAKRYTHYGRTVSHVYYYEYAREEACSITRLYTGSTLDSIGKEEANKHFSAFVSRGWARMRKEAQANCEASPPSDLLSICR